MAGSFLDQVCWTALLLYWYTSVCYQTKGLLCSLKIVEISKWWWPTWRRGKVCFESAIMRKRGSYRWKISIWWGRCYCFYRQSVVWFYMMWKEFLTQNFIYHAYVVYVFVFFFLTCLPLPDKSSSARREARNIKLSGKDIEVPFSFSVAVSVFCTTFWGGIDCMFL